jgi:hypothetical protein
MGLGEAHRHEKNEDPAMREFRAARSTFEQVGATQQAARAARECGDVAASDVAQPLTMCHREGDYWSITFEGHTVRVRDVKGIRYLSRLLAEPGREFHVLDLVAFEHGSAPDVNGSTEAGMTRSMLGDAGAMIDASAKQAYRRRLAEIEEDIEEARATGDIERETQADAERDFLVRELSRAVGLGGRDRRAGSSSERARASVTRALRSALDRIREHGPALAEHLDRSIRTGTYCAYFPNSRA